MSGERVIHIQHIPDEVSRDDVVYIGRRNNRYGLLGSKWQNRFRIAKGHTREEAIEQYRKWFTETISMGELWEALPELRGKVLACWCAPQPCHGDVLIELLNKWHPEQASSIGGLPSSAAPD